MSQASQDFSKFGFVEKFVLPALLVFLVPVFSFIYFRHAQELFDARSREASLQSIRADPKLSDQDRAALIAFVTETPFSQIIADERFADAFDATTHFYYGTFRWMIRLSFLSVAVGVTVFLLTGACTWFSLRSQLAQYLSLLVGWHVLRIYGALQTIVIGILVVALSFWITALWFNVYFVKLILIAGAFAVAGVVAVIAAIFKNPQSKFVVDGVVLKKHTANPLWQALSAICAKAGADPPDQVVAGIDDNFFVTEQPITVDGKLYQGKTLFVSLALLKQLHAAEAEAVLAHEMAHFSGQDTLYSKKTAPLLQRYEAYLQALHGGVITLPVFYFMLCFYVLFELSLGKLRREREFRADGIAAATTSPGDFAAALLRIAAYSKFRNTVELEQFKNEQILDAAGISRRIEHGFPAYAVNFTADPDIGQMETAHPFDSHPPLSQRLNALGVRLDEEEVGTWLATAGDGLWRLNIPDADELERSQWQAFEERFRNFHEATLPYRFLPETDEERAVVEKFFPPLDFTNKSGTLSIDYEKIKFTDWADVVYHREISKLVLSEDGKLQIHLQGGLIQTRTIAIKEFAQQQQEVLEVVQRYYCRYLSAVEYQEQMNSETEAEDQSES